MPRPADDDVLVDAHLTDLDGLAGRELLDCTIEGVDAEAAALHGMRLEGCRFVDCQLRLATFTGTRLGDTAFLRCNLTGVDWTKASWSSFSITQGLAFAGCTLDYATFHGLSLQGLVVYDCSAKDADFGSCDLTGSDLRFTDLTDSRFDGSTLTDASLDGATGYHFDPREVRAGHCRVTMPEAARLLAPLGFDVVGDAVAEPLEAVLDRRPR